MLERSAAPRLRGGIVAFCAHLFVPVRRNESTFLQVDRRLQVTSTEGFKKHELAARSMYFFQKKIAKRPGTFGGCSPYYFGAPGAPGTLGRGQKPCFLIFVSMFFGTLCKRRGADKQRSHHGGVWGGSIIPTASAFGVVIFTRGTIILSLTERERPYWLVLKDNRGVCLQKI